MATSDVPLGLPSYHQYEKGLDVLRRLDRELSRSDGPDRKALVDLTNEYYTTIPHAFGGRRRPPLMDSTEAVREEIAHVEAHMRQLLAAHAEEVVWQFDSRHGWFDFDPESSQKVEEVYRARQQRPGDFTKEQVEVRGGPDQWLYTVHLDTMTQTNLEHPNHRTRSIRRVPASMSRPPTAARG